MVQEPSGIIDAVEGDVLRLQAAQVAQHLGLAAMAMEDRVGQERRGRGAGRRDARRRVARRARRDVVARARPPKSAEQRRRSSARRGLVERRCRAGPSSTKRRLMPASRAAAISSSWARPGTRRVSVSKKASCTTSMPSARRPPARIAVSRCTRRAIRVRPSGPCQTAYMPAMTASSTCAVQMLRGRLLAADVLLAGLQRHAQRRLAAAVDRDADDPARHGALVRVLGGEEGGVRPAIAHRHAEALGRAERRCRHPARPAASAASAPGGRWRRRRGRPAAWTAAMAGRRSRIAPSLAGYCSRAPNTASAVELGQRDRPTTSSMPRWPGAGPQHGERLRVQSRVDEEQGGFAAADAVRHGHGLGGGGGLVEQRGVGQLHAGEVDHHLLDS